MLKQTLVPVAMIALIGSACGGLSGKQANELNEEQRQQVCEDFADYAANKISDEDQKNFACVLAGETAAAIDMNTTCEEARDACLAEPAEDPVEESTDCSVTEETDCTATVGEIRDCYEAQVDALADFYSEFDCGAESTNASGELPPECEVVQEKCPDFFGSQSAE